MNDYTLGNGPDSLDLAERDHARYEAEGFQSDEEWEQEREEKILRRAEEMLEDEECVREALSDTRIVGLFLEGDMSSFQIGGMINNSIQVIIIKMAIEEIDKEYS